MGKIILITGGARSGKSSHALATAMESYECRAFIATAEALDDEMRERIAKHKSERRNFFDTIEEPVDLMAAFGKLFMQTEVAIIDCLTVWLGNLFHRNQDDSAAVRRIIDAFADDLKARKNRLCDLIFVTNEVGWGIVPENRLSRDYRDLAGHLNRRVAEISDQVVLCVSGIPVEIKGQFSPQNTWRGEAAARKFEILNPKS